MLLLVSNQNHAQCQIQSIRAAKLCGSIRGLCVPQLSVPLCSRSSSIAASLDKRRPLVGRNWHCR